MDRPALLRHGVAFGSFEATLADLRIRLEKLAKAAQQAGAGDNERQAFEQAVGEPRETGALYAADAKKLCAGCAPSPLRHAEAPPSILMRLISLYRASRR